MTPKRVVPRSSFERDSLPLDSARTAFEWLVTGPAPLSLDGRFYPGLPARAVPLDELRELLLDPDLPIAAVDLVWMYLVRCSRTQGGSWTVACVGLALPALFAVAAELCARFADDHHDIHAAMLTGFLTELAEIDLARPWVMWRLRCAALRAGHRHIRDALDRPIPTDEDFASRAPARPDGHPDFVLARAVAEGAITREEAELIGATRLEDYPLSAAAAELDVPVTTLHTGRSQAEARLLAWTGDHTHREGRDSDVELGAIHAATITTAARDTGAGPRRPKGKSRRVSTAAEKFSITVRYRRRKNGSENGVEGCGRKPATPTPARPAAARRPSDPTPEQELPRCA